MKQETLVALVQHIVHHFLIELRAESSSGESLRFTAGEDGRAVRRGERAYFAPDGANLRCLTSVEALAFVENATAHCVAFYIVIVSVDERILFFEFVSCQVGMCFSIFLFEVLAESIESVHAIVLRQSLTDDVVSGLIKFVANFLTQLFIIHFVAVFALHVGAEFLH